VILLDERLDRRTARCVLAHELGHMALGHHGGPVFADSGWRARRQESDADRWAATRLVDVHELARVAAERPHDPASMARHLRITDHMLNVWLRQVGPRARAVLHGTVAAVDHAA
jgi:Zn-dependent peptidase ImmA (M78 family)